MNMAAASGRNIFPDNFTSGVSPSSTYPLCILWWNSSFQNWFWRKSKRRIRNILVDVRAYFDKQGSLNMLSYLQALVVLEVKSMKSSPVHTDIVAFIDCIDCFGFIFKKWYKCLFAFAWIVIFLFQRKIMTVGFLNYNY